jgi:hypothetical protein
MRNSFGWLRNNKRKLLGERASWRAAIPSQTARTLIRPTSIPVLRRQGREIDSLLVLSITVNGSRDARPPNPSLEPMYCGTRRFPAIVTTATDSALLGMANRPHELPIPSAAGSEAHTATSAHNFRCCANECPNGALASATLDCLPVN